MPVPLIAKRPKLTSCHSPGPPSSDTYWHIGDETIRLRATTERNFIGVKRRGVSGGMSFIIGISGAGAAVLCTQPHVREDALDHLMIFQLTPRAMDSRAVNWGFRTVRAINER